MARITSRDCERVMPNRYELVLLAAELARELPDSSQLARRPRHKSVSKTVAALRRIAERNADPECLRINCCRRTKNVPLLGVSNDDLPIASVVDQARDK